MVIVVGPEDRARVEDARCGLAPRLDYRLIAEGFPGTTVEEWYPTPAVLQGSKPLRVVRSLSANLRLAMALVRRLPPDSVLYSTSETWGIPIALALALAGTSHRHITCVHRVFSADRLTLLRILRPLLRVDGWICVTERQRVMLARALGNDAVTVTAVSPGVDTIFYDRAATAVGESTPYILAVGASERNYGLLFAAAQSLDAQVVVRLSSPWMRPSDQMPGCVPSNVRLITQPLSYGELRDLYAGALLVAVPLRPTLQAAGITTILEAMAMGRCVVATDSQGLPEILQDGRTGVVVEQSVAALREGLERCLADVAWREGFASAGRCVARERASLEYHASQVTAFIRQAAGM